MAAGKTAVFDAENSATEDRKRRDLWELSVGYGLILLVIWTPSPWQRPLYWVAAASILAVSWRSFNSWPAMGLRRTNLLRSLWVVGVALLAAAVAVLVAERLHTLRAWDGPVELIQRFWGYTIWAFLQQFLVQVFVFGRLLRLVPSKKLAVALAAAIFAVAHLPSPILTVATLLWGLAACWLFLRYRNLYPLAIAHAILGITLAITCPGPVTHNMRVGLGYLTYSTRRFHHRSHKDHIASTDAWVIADAPTLRS